MELIYEAKSFNWKVLCPSLVMLILFRQSYGQNETKGMTFFEDTLCDLNERLTDRCSTRVPNSRSKVECLLVCMDENSCIGSSLDENGDCFKHYECPSISRCKTEFQNHFYVSKQCDHGGVWLPINKTCQCVSGWVGAACNRYPRTVLELASYGYEGSFNNYFLDPKNDMKNPISISGAVTPTYHQIDIMYNWGLGGFNRSWDDYRDGFRGDYDGLKTFWIGLKWLHALTEAGYTKLLFVISINGVGQPYRQYFNFRVSDEANGFSYTYDNTMQGMVNGYIVGNCLGPYKNTRFSTWDRDGDDDVDENCASRAGSAWWYKDCNNPCNMLGWGPDFFDTKPSYETMSVLGIDIRAENLASVNFRMYIMMP